MFNNSSNNEEVNKPMAFMHKITCTFAFIIRIHRTQHSACLSEILIYFLITRPEQEGGGGGMFNASKARMLFSYLEAIR